MNITIVVPDNPDDLGSLDDAQIAFYWHLSQHNPALASDYNADRFAIHVNREIIRRWVQSVPPLLWQHGFTLGDPPRFRNQEGAK